MARRARGAEVLEMAQEMILRANTIDELRQAQALVLPLAYGMSLEQTARVIGRSVVWTCRLRNRFLAGETVGDAQRERPGGRRRENLSMAREREVLEPFLERARNGGILVVPQIKVELRLRRGGRDQFNWNPDQLKGAWCNRDARRPTRPHPRAPCPPPSRRS